MSDIALDDFINMLGKGSVAHAHYVEKALRAAIGHVEKASKEMLGHDRPEWPPLSPATQNERAMLGYTPDEPLLRAGHLHDAIESDVELDRVGGTAICGVKDATVGDGSKADPIRNIGDVAVWMELGTGRAPARSFLAQAAIDTEKKILEELGHHVVEGLFDPTGRRVAGQLVF